MSKCQDSLDTLAETESLNLTFASYPGNVILSATTCVHTLLGRYADM